MSALIALLLANPWRSVAIAMVLIACVQSLRLDSAQAAQQTAEDRAAAATALERSTAVQWELSHLQLQGDLRTCQAQWADLDRRSAAAVQVAIAARREAEATLADYRARFDARSQHCGAALLDAGSACTELEGY